jgi:hypothetical protein
MSSLGALSRRRSAALALLAATTGCETFEPPPPPPQFVIVKVTSDPGVPLEGVSLRFGGTAVASTDATGRGELKLEGRDGEPFDIAVVCPEGYTSPNKPIPVTLRRLADPEARPEYVASCPPAIRTIVVAVRADGGPNLPVLRLGKEIARTDEAGAAHVLLRLPPEQGFDLTLSTADADQLRPQNPTASFVVKGRDEVVTFDQKFETAHRAVIARPARPKGPVRIP